MEHESAQRRDRYSTAGNVESEYADIAQTVLVNKKGIAAAKTAFRRDYRPMIEVIRSATEHWQK